VVTAVEVCQHQEMSTEQAQKASPDEQGRFGFVSCIGAALMFLAVVLLVKAGDAREVVGTCIVLVVGADLMLPRGERSGRAVRVARTVLLAVGLTLVGVEIAVL
jgi:hypothetical protein